MVGNLVVGYNGDNLETATSPISNGNPDIVIDTDASLIGWGAVCNAATAQGSFTPSCLLC